MGDEGDTEGDEGESQGQHRHLRSQRTAVAGDPVRVFRKRSGHGHARRRPSLRFTERLFDSTHLSIDVEGQDTGHIQRSILENVGLRMLA